MQHILQAEALRLSFAKLQYIIKKSRDLEHIACIKTTFNSCALPFSKHVLFMTSCSSHDPAYSWVALVSQGGLPVLFKRTVRTLKEFDIPPITQEARQVSSLKIEWKPEFGSQPGVLVGIIAQNSCLLYPCRVLIKLTSRPDRLRQDVSVFVSLANRHSSGVHSTWQT